MTGTEFKYKINYFINLFHVSLDEVHEVLQKYFGITQEQFTSDRYISADSEDEIPLVRLTAYAYILSVPIESIASSQTSQ